MSGFELPNTSRTQSNSAVFTNVAFNTQPVMAIAANEEREDLMIFNDSNKPLLISFTGNVSTTEYSVKVLAQGYYESGVSVFTNAVYLMWIDDDGTGAGQALVTELEG